MINADELMIGNLFIGYDDKVFPWDIEHFNLLWCDVPVDEIIKRPIPISKNLLLKFGFQNSHKFPNILIKDDIKIHVYVKRIMFIYNEYHLMDIQFCHELQNLITNIKKQKLILNTNFDHQSDGTNTEMSHSSLS